MRKKILLIVALAVFLTGCAGLQFQNSDQIALQIVAQRTGYYVAKGDPDIVPTAKMVAQGVMASETSDIAKVALDLAITELAKQFPDDPLLESDLRLIASGIQLDAPDVQLDLAVLRPIVAAFIHGMDVALE